MIAAEIAAIINQTMVDMLPGAVALMHRHYFETKHCRYKSGQQSPTFFTYCWMTKKNPRNGMSHNQLYDCVELDFGEREIPPSSI